MAGFFKRLFCESGVTRLGLVRRGTDALHQRCIRTPSGRLHLPGADLWGTNLWGAGVRARDPRKADITRPNPQQADLGRVNHAAAGLAHANLGGANLAETNREHAGSACGEEGRPLQRQQPSLLMLCVIRGCLSRKTRETHKVR